MKVLVLNSYAGSLTLGASNLGAEIIGSYEDHNFGLDIQKANFPELRYLSYRHEWPRQDLSDVTVIAHPPCSAFSVQNCSPTARGVNSNAFACTKHVLQYACDNNAKAIAIESVMGALGGAWWQHQQYADDYGYHLYRVLENGCMFGAQWRDRFWVVYIRRDAAPRRNMTFTISPIFKTVSEVVSGWTDGPSAGNQDSLLVKQLARLKAEPWFTPEDEDFFFGDHPHPTRALGTMLFERKFKTPTSTSMDKWNVFKKYIGGFASGTMVYLDPTGLAPVLMGGSHWYYGGRNLSENGFKRIMGFPGDYVFPKTPRNTRTQLRMYLSKGVMPPIAKWALEQISRHLGETRGLNLHHDVLATGTDGYRLECEPDHIADFRITKDGWWLRHERLPELRQHIDERHLAPEEPLTTDQRETFKRAVEFIKLVPIHDEEVELENQRSLILKSIEDTLNPPEPVIEPRPMKVRITRVSVEPGTRKIVILKSTRMLGTHIRAAPGAIFGQGLTDRKRQQIHTYLTELGVVTLEVAVNDITPRLSILPTTARWHVRQMMAAGQVLEATPDEVQYQQVNVIPHEVEPPLTEVNV